MNTLTKLAMVAAASLLLSSNAMALPLAGEKVTITDGLGNGSGGQFNLDIGSNGSVDYYSFCVEMNEYFTPGGEYIIQSVEDYASNGGRGGQTAPGKDYLSEATKWVMWNYYNNEGIFYQATRTAEFATHVQNIIWSLEDELSGYTSSLFTQVQDQGSKVGGYAINGGTVKVLNLVDQAGGYAQSQLVAAPVPEPTTMLLFGTGLIGLAGIARRRSR